jgi:glutamate N-acetyltransferase / amino-acid N-acetyltransferase
VRWPGGIRSAGIHCGIKRKRLDLGVMVADAPVTWAGVFTRNAAAAPCIAWSRACLGKPVRAVVVNSGNANACTGEAGAGAVLRTAEAAAGSIGCSRDEVLVSSTGPIGVPLPVDKIVAGLPLALGQLGGDPAPLAEAIRTTDTRIKLTRASVDECVIVGVAKGAAMLSPNMATMLTFLATDAALPQDLAQECLAEAVEHSFNRICVDACESTNDSVYLLSTNERRADVGRFSRALARACRHLAMQIVRDAEGGSKLVRVEINGAADDAVAVGLGRAIASSSLWRAAVHGADPNWGRILAAAGAVHRDLDLGRVELWIGSELLFARGRPCGSLEAATKAMEDDEFTVAVSLADGPGSAEILHTDLSVEYVSLNAFGRT